MRSVLMFLGLGKEPSEKERDDERAKEDSERVLIDGGINQSSYDFEDPSDRSSISIQSITDRVVQVSLIVAAVRRDSESRVIRCFYFCVILGCICWFCQ